MDTDVYGANIYNQILENSNQHRVKSTKKKGGLGTIIKDASDLDSDTIQPSSMQNNRCEQTHFEFLLNDNSFRSEAETIKSILVKTGVFQGDHETLDKESKDELVYSHKDMIIDNSLRKPDYLCDNVHEAVKLIFEKENFS